MQWCRSAYRTSAGARSRHDRQNTPPSLVGHTQKMTPLLRALIERSASTGSSQSIEVTVISQAITCHEETQNSVCFRSLGRFSRSIKVAERGACHADSALGAVTVPVGFAVSVGFGFFGGGYVVQKLRPHVGHFQNWFGGQGWSWAGSRNSICAPQRWQRI